MGLFRKPKLPKAPKPVIAAPTPFRPQPAAAVRPLQATNASLDSRISAPNQSGRISILGGGETRKRTLLGA